MVCCCYSIYFRYWYIGKTMWGSERPIKRRDPRQISVFVSFFRQVDWMIEGEETERMELRKARPCLYTWCWKKEQKRGSSATASQVRGVGFDDDPEVIITLLYISRKFCRFYICAFSVDQVLHSTIALIPMTYPFLRFLVYQNTALFSTFRSFFRPSQAWHLNFSR